MSFLQFVIWFLLFYNIQEEIVRTLCFKTLQKLLGISGQMLFQSSLELFSLFRRIEFCKTSLTSCSYKSRHRYGFGYKKQLSKGSLECQKYLKIIWRQQHKNLPAKEDIHLKEFSISIQVLQNIDSGTIIKNLPIS